MSKQLTDRAEVFSPATDFSFFRVQTRSQALSRLDRFDRLPAEEAPLAGAGGRVLAEDVKSPENLPTFTRSTVDGFAVRARETFGASESLPALFTLDGEAVMGRTPDKSLSPGRTMRVWTGGCLPEGADAVVMLEYARFLDQTTVELTKAAAPGTHTIQVGEDVARGETIIPAGRRLRAQDLGLLAGLGITRVPVVRRPRLAVISTGNELVGPDEDPPPGMIRDINSTTLGRLAVELGAEAEYLGLCRDDPAQLREMVARGLDRADAVLVSGGSSVGAADWTLSTFLSFEPAELLVHGVSISPGKPLILVETGGKSLWGLPGHVASAFISFQLFVRPLIARLTGWTGAEPVRRTAVLKRNLASAQGREDWIRVRLVEGPDGPLAEPVLGPSGLISTLVEADGLLRIPLELEGLPAGAAVEVHLF